jgi:hypothetical protein
MYADDASGIEARLSHDLLRKKNASTKHNALRKNQERRVFNRVGGGITPAVLPHHRTCGSASGGS